MPFNNADEVVHYIGGIFETAFADPEIGPKLKATGIVLRVISTDPESAFVLDMGNHKVLAGDTQTDVLRGWLTTASPRPGPGTR